MDKLQKQYFIY